MGSLPEKGGLLLFCGGPGTLKTFLSSRLASYLGFAYLPTSAVGRLEYFVGSERRTSLLKKRRQRYAQVARVARNLVDAGVTVIVDGGFPELKDRKRIAATVAPRFMVLIHCRCADTEALRTRLASRSRDRLDHEQSSAEEIEESLRYGVASWEDLDVSVEPTREIEATRVDSVLSVDTSPRALPRGAGGAGRAEVTGLLPVEVAGVLGRLVDRILESHENSRRISGSAADETDG